MKKLLRTPFNQLADWRRVRWGQRPEDWATLSSNQSCSHSLQSLWGKAMRIIISRSAIVLIVLCQMLAGCGRTPSEESAKSESFEAQIAPAQQQRTLQEPAPANVLQASPVQNAAAGTTKALPKDVVILRGSPLGAVKFEHKLHSEARSIKCETCHHASKPEKPATAPQQACSDCHTKVAISPMKTKLQAAFHNPTATAGTCIDCHKAVTAKGKVPPVKCSGCHKKENI